MNSLSGIRAINNGNKPVAAQRYQRQYKGNQWVVFDSWTGGCSKPDADVHIVDARVDELNAAQAATNRAQLTAKLDAFERDALPGSKVVAQAQDLNENLRKA